MRAVGFLAKFLEQPSTQAKGASGVVNFGGRIIREPIADLRDTQGFGRAGTYDWGFWANLPASNSFVKQAIDHVCSPIAGARLDVELPEVDGLDPTLAQQMTDFVKWNLTEQLRLTQHADAAARGFLVSGFALFEPTYQAATGRWAGKWALKSLEERLPQSLSSSPWKEEDGRLVGIQQLVPPRPLVTLPAQDVLLYSWQRVGTNWAGESSFRSVQYIAGHVMPMLLKLAGVALQREGAGIPTVTGDKDAPLTPEQRTQLVELLSNLTFHENANVVMPPGWNLNWIFSPGANKNHILDAWRTLGITVLQCLGAQQLALGTGDTGSRSVGEVHDARTAVTVQRILSFVESVMNGDSGEAHTGLVPRLCRINFGEQVAYPRLKLTMVRSELPVSDLMDAIQKARASGVLTARFEDENVMRERMSLPPITREEWDAGAASRTVAPAPGVPTSTPAPVPAAQPSTPVVASAPKTAWKPWRELRASESKLKLKDLDAYFAAQRDIFAAKVKPVVVGMLGKAAPAIAKTMADGKVTPEETAAVPLDPKQLDGVVASYLDSVRRAGAGFVRDELSGQRALRAAEGDAPENDATQEADDIVAAQQKALTRRVVQRVRGEIERQSIDAMRTGEGADSVIARVIDSTVDSGAFRGDAGSVVTKVFNTGRDEAARLIGGVAKVEYSAILDSATCGPCRADDGKTADFNSAEHDRLTPPNRDCAGGDNCRCLLVYIPAEGA